MSFVLEIPLYDDTITVFVCKGIVSNDNPPPETCFHLDMFGNKHITKPSKYYMDIKFVDFNKLYTTTDSHVHQINPPPQILNLLLIDQIMSLKEHGFEWLYCAKTKVSLGFLKNKNVTKEDIQKYLDDNKIIPENEQS